MHGCRLSAAVSCLVSFITPFSASAQVPSHQADLIRKAAPAKARVAPKRARTVLIWNTPPAFMDKDPHKGYCIPYGELAMKVLGEKTGAYKPVVSDDISVYLPENIRRFDAIVMNNSSGPWIRPAEADLEKLKAYGHDVDAAEKALRKSLLDYVANGGGIVAYHYAIGANPQWPQFRELLGGKFIGHPWNEEVGIQVEEPRHPLVAAFGGKDFRLADEIYEFGEPYSRQNLRVLLSLDTQKTNMKVPWVTRKDGDFAQAWVKPHGSGRVFFTGFGHRTEIWWHPALLRFYLDAIQFACGDLEAPTAPRPAGGSRPSSNENAQLGKPERGG
ncbi:MAG: ThuA domain-containing protein [Phycisphaerae bacterium]|nr:ThuA domain-containing protein [Phycisphaerae bacterium]